MQTKTNKHRKIKARTNFMKFRKLKQLNQTGMLHHVIPLIVIVLFGVLGVGYFVLSHAASPQQVTMAFTTVPGTGQSSTPSGDCLTGGLTVNSSVYVETCTNAGSSNWQLTAQTINNPSTHLCLAPTTTKIKAGTNPVVPVVTVQCAKNQQLQEWVRPNSKGGWISAKTSTSMMANVYMYNQLKRKECLVDPNNTIQPSTKLRTPVAMVGCSATNNVPDQDWTTMTYPTASTITHAKK
jgi:hypothetical protein